MRLKQIFRLKVSSQPKFNAFFSGMRKKFSEVARLFCAAGSVVFRIKIKYNFFAFVIAQITDFSVLIRQGKFRRRSVDG